MAKCIKKENLLKGAFILVLALMVLTVSIFYKRFDGGRAYNYLALSYDTTDHIYLSDINYIEEESYVEPGYYLRLDKNNSSGLITLNIEGVKTPFIKGIAAWATSNLVYDVSGYDYDYFTAYIGVDAKEVSTYYNSGVTFTIYTSKDGEEWTTAYTSGIKKGWDDAEYVKIPLKDVKYLRLYAYENGDSWYSMWYDDAVYADAKLIKEGYEEVKTDDNSIVKKISDYDALIKNYESEIKEGTFTNLDKYNLTLLQREFVSNVGYDILQALFRYSSHYKDVLNWLMNDKETLELYVLGGEPDGNYATSLSILNELYFKYKDTDLKNTSVTENGVALKDLYKEMIITLSLTHSANVGLWVSGAPEDPDDPNGSNAVDRYEIFKKLHEDGLLINNIFETISVEEMRFVMNNIIDDEEIIWLNHYTTENNSKNPYTYITYRFGYEYNNPKYYVEDSKDMWNSKKRGNLPYAYNFKDYGITYKEGYPKLWIVFEEGSVCGGLSKTGSNIWGSYGVPSSVVSQPGHAAYIYMSIDDNGHKVWNLYNDVSGWGQSGKTEKLSVRMPNGWGSGSYAGGFPASYVVLAQAALDDYDNYKIAEEILMSAKVYEDDPDVLEKIYRAALDKQNINFDAWLGLVETYEMLEKSESDFYSLAEEIATTLKNYPLPMYDLLRMISNNIQTPSYKARYIELVKTTLEEATKEDKSVVNDNVKRQVANYLLNANKDAVATFAFDGDNAGKIVLSKSFDGNGVSWQYNLKSSLSANDWQDAEGLEHQLTDEELDLINAETDIHIRIVGALDVVYDIPVEAAKFPASLAINDNENVFVGLTDSMEWKFIDDEEWTRFSEKEPDLSGDTKVLVRVGRFQNFTPSEEQEFTFTSNGESETNKYVSFKRLEIDSVSSDEPGHDNGKEHAIDGNLNTMWHTAWDGSDNDKFIVLKLDEPSYITSLEYVPRQSSTNGIVLNAKVLVSMDNENWTEVVSETEWALNNLSKTVDFEKVEKAQYVKVIGTKTSGNYMSAAMINLFEDAKRKTPPTAEIEYSTKSLTNKDVVVKLVNANKDITITNNEGKNTYTFTKNGSFTFEFEDADYNKGSVTATVDWIDKVAPKANLKYSTTSETKDNVTVELISDEDIEVIGNNGSKKYTFTKNGSFTFNFKDKAGNESKLEATVNWIIDENKTTNDSQNNSSNNSTNNNVNSSSDNNSSTNNNNNTTQDNNGSNNQESSSNNSNQGQNSNNNNYGQDTNNNSSQENNNSEEHVIQNNQTDNNVEKTNTVGYLEIAIIVCIVLIVTLLIAYIIIRNKNNRLS